MKTITLESVRVREIRYRPSDSEPNVTIYYDLLDDEGNVVGEKVENINVAKLPSQAKGAVTSYLNNFSAVLEDKELKNEV